MQVSCMVGSHRAPRVNPVTSRDNLIRAGVVTGRIVDTKNP